MKQDNELSDLLNQAKAKVIEGGKYYHYKYPDRYYEVIKVGLIEADLSVCVIYQALYGEHLVFVRPIDVWLSTVKWQGKTVRRFTKV